MGCVQISGQKSSYHQQSETHLKKIRKFNPTLEYSITQNQSRRLGKVGRQGAICWLKKKYPRYMVQLIFILGSKHQSIDSYFHIVPCMSKLNPKKNLDSADNFRNYNNV